MKFDSDRFRKYFDGFFRLAALTALSFTFKCNPYFEGTTGSIITYDPGLLYAYLSSWRLLHHAPVGLIGAIVNVSNLRLEYNIVILGVVAAGVIADFQQNGSAIVIVLLKTMIGDQLAGKLDTVEWKLVLLFVLVLSTAVYYTAGDAARAALYIQHGPTLLYLTIVQFICEYGDNHYEQLSFFRYRYSYEILTSFLYIFTATTEEARMIIRIDMVICMFYRLSNMLLLMCSYSSHFITDADTFVKVCIFKLFGYCKGVTFMHVSDPEVAALVLKASGNKGYGIERYIANPAWAPILSLESVDGDLYTGMRKDFDFVLKKIPDLSSLQSILKRNISDLVANKEAIIDAEVIAKLTLATFIEYLFDRKWESKFQVLVDASWEWRKEISIRGKADATVKARAVDLVVNDLLPNKKELYAVFEEKWTDPRYYSLLMQPFIISPAINVGDIMSAVYLLPDLSLEDAIRRLHPFPILERYIDSDIVHNNTVVVKADTQVIMFVSDFQRYQYQWNIFGGGSRVCAGKHIALPVLRVMKAELSGLPTFRPLVNHRYSGRNNDVNMSLSETIYYISMVYKLMQQPGKDVKTRDTF